MNDAVVRLEGFASPLKGQRLWVCGPPSTIGKQILNRLTVLEEELLGRGRKVLLIQNQRDLPMRWSQKTQWDAVFRIRETQDLRLSVTYIQNAAKPIRVVWIGDEPPSTLLAAVNTSDITFIVGSTTVPRGVWSAIFWHTTTDQPLIEEGLGSRMGGPTVQKLNLPSVLRELKASNVGLVWSSIGEKEKGGSVYWYDAEEETVTNEPMEPREMSSLLREIADSICPKE